MDPSGGGSILCSACIGLADATVPPSGFQLRGPAQENGLWSPWESWWLRAATTSPNPDLLLPHLPLVNRNSWVNCCGSASCSKITISRGPLQWVPPYLGTSAMHPTGTEIGKHWLHHQNKSRKDTNQRTPRTAIDVTFNGRNTLDPFTVLLSGLSQKNEARPTGRKTGVNWQPSSKLQQNQSWKGVLRDLLWCSRHCIRDFPRQLWIPRITVQLMAGIPCIRTRLNRPVLYFRFSSSWVMTDK